MIGFDVRRVDGVTQRVTVRLVDHARLERLRGASSHERPFDTLDLLQLAHIAAQREGEPLGFDEWAATVVDVDPVTERPTQPAG